MSTSLFFRIVQHLLPDALAWRIRRRGPVPWYIGDGHEIGDPELFIGGPLEMRPIELFFWALSNPHAAAKQFLDAVYLDRFAETTRELEEYERQFGLVPAALESDRRRAIAAAWKATGGQDPHYLQATLQAAGFNLYVHEWWASGPPYVARDPRDYTIPPRIGTAQCSSFPDQPQCSSFSDQPECNNLLANDPGYLVNPLPGQPPPPVPADPVRWPFFIYWGAETFPNRASVPASRRAELESLLMRICPAHLWVVLLVDFTEADS